MRKLYVVIQALFVGISLMLSPGSAAAVDACDGIDNDGDGYFDESTVVVAANCGVAIPEHSSTGNGSPGSCSLTVTETRAVLDTNLNVTISHSFDADLEVDLETPGGQHRDLPAPEFPRLLCRWNRPERRLDSLGLGRCQR